MSHPLRNKNTSNDPNLNGTITQTIFNIGGATPILGSPFVVLAADPNLTNERILTAGSVTTITDNGPNSSVIVDVADSAVTPGTYAYPTSVTVDQKGRITAVAGGSAPTTQTTVFNDTGTNANAVFLGGKLNTDTVRRWSATVSGDLTWGDGSAAKVRLNYAGGSVLQIVDPLNNPVDLTLSTLRGNAAIFSTPNTFNVSFETRTTGDANPRFQVQGSGLIGIGGGASGMDTYLWRSGNAELSLGSSPTTADAYLRATGIKTASGDLTIAPAGSNVNFSTKNLIGIAALTASTSITTPSIASASGDLIINPFANANFSNKNVIGVGTLTSGAITAPSLNTASGDLSLGSATGLINMNNTAQNNVNYIKFTAAGQTIARGVTDGTLEITDGSFNPGSIKVSNIYTTTGDLVLSPAGSNINCSGKNLINVNLPSSSLSFPIVYTSSAAANQFLKTNVTGDSYERWSVDAKGMQAWGPGGAAILADTWLYRTAVGELTLSGQIPQNGNLSGILAVNSIKGVSNLYITVLSGNIDFSNKPVINMSSLSVNGTTTSGRFATAQSVDATTIFSNTNSNNTTDPSFAINSAGGLIWASTAGPSAADVSLWRSGANALGIGSVNGSNSGGRLVVDAITSVNTLQLGCGTSNGNTTAATLSAQALIASRSSSITSTAQHQAMLACSGGSVSGGGARNVMIGCSGGTISASGGTNIMLGCDSGSSITSTAAGNICLGPVKTIASSTNCVIIGGNRNTSASNVGNVILTSNDGTTAGAPGGGQSFEGRMSGGYWLATNTANSTGLQMGPGTSAWSTISDARSKRLYRTLSHEEKALARGVETDILGALDGYELYEYHYLDSEHDKTPTVVGPTTQSFYGSFGRFIGKEPQKRVYTGAWDAEGNCLSNCFEVGDEIEMLDERDEKTAMWLVMKKLKMELDATKNENKELREGRQWRR